MNPGAPVPPPPPGSGMVSEQPPTPQPAYTAPQPKPQQAEPEDYSRTRIIGADDFNAPKQNSGNGFKIIMIVAGVLIVIGLGIAAYFLLLADKPSSDKYNYEDEENTTEAAIIEEIPVETEIPAEEPTAETPTANQTERPAETPVSTPRRGASVWKDGRNVLIGTFSYAGSKYGFTVTLDYSSSTGRATNATYEAHGYGKASPLSIATISSDGTVLSLRGTSSGTPTEINAHASEGSSTFIGEMRRGDHQGACTLTLQ